MPAAEKADLAALLGSRICHDLISPIGAIGNGVELLLMDGNVKGPEMALISESVANANARIRFFRVAFGAASIDQRIGRSEVTGILADLLRGGRLSVDWQSPNDMARREVKLAFLLVLCLETAMPYGGRIALDLTDGRWSLVAQSRKFLVNPDLWEVLSNPAAAAEIGPSHVHFLLVPDECARQNRRLTADLRETEIRLSL